MDRTTLETLLGEGLSLAQIGRRMGKDHSTVGYWLKSYGLRAAGHEKYAAKGGLRREDLEPLVVSGESLNQIAESVGRSTATVRHWLRRYGLKTTAKAGVVELM